MDRLNEKAKSKSQQKLFGMVHAYKDGKLKLKDLDSGLAKKIKDIAYGSKKKDGKKGKGISKKDAKDYASTKHKGLPEKVKESFNDFLNEEIEKEELLKGGEAQGMTIEDIAELHNFDIQKLKKYLQVGVQIEREHSKHKWVQTRITLDHLKEHPLYYHNTLGLPEMERRLEELESINEN